MSVSPSHVCVCVCVVRADESGVFVYVSNTEGEFRTEEFSQHEGEL